LAIADTKYCEYAFVTHTGQRLRVVEDVEEVIDEYLARIPSLAGWAGPQRGALRWSPQYRYVGFPYRLYLLTVSPIVIMVVPIAKAPPAAFCGEGIRDGCLRSKKLDEPIRFLAAPEIQPDSFWFSPDLKTPERRIPNDETHVVIPLGSSKLDLTSNGTKWEVRRSQ
jgi:hypothetical protein